MRAVTLALLMAGGLASCSPEASRQALALEQWRTDFALRLSMLEGRAGTQVGRYQIWHQPSNVLGPDRILDTTTGELFAPCEVPKEQESVTGSVWCLVRASPTKTTSDAIWNVPRVERAKPTPKQ